MKAIAEAKAKEEARVKASYDSATDPFSADDEGMEKSKITKRASSDKETPQRGARIKKRRTHKERTKALMDRLTNEIVQPPGTPTPIIANPAPEVTKIKELMLPPPGTPPRVTPRQTPPTRPKPKAKAKPTTVKKKPAAIKQDDKMSKKSTQQPPSKISVQVIRELFEDAKNKKTTTAAVYLEFADIWKHFTQTKATKR